MSQCNNTKLRQSQQCGRAEPVIDRSCVPCDKSHRKQKTETNTRPSDCDALDLLKNGEIEKRPGSEPSVGPELEQNAGYAPKQSCQPLSMTSLIHWNIKRVQKINPNLNLKEALRSTFEKLDNGSYDASSIDPDDAQERHLTCAALAWRALGHSDLTALHRLVTSTKCKHDAGDIPCTRIGLNSEATNRSESRRHSHSSDDSFYSDLRSFNSHPLDKLPMDAKLVMHVAEPDKHPENPPKQTKQRSKKDIEKKVEAACCPDTSCATRLAEFDSAVDALRARSVQLARRDAERAELLERAETAWHDLETGYQRRLQVLQEKEDDLNRQIKDLVEERNGYKKTCTSIAEFLKERGSIVEQECQRLNATEKELCDCTCQRHLLAEDATRADNLLGEQHCRCVQQDRDLQFKEEQLRRKAASLRSTLELQRALALEAERAARVELVSLREQGQATTDEVLRIETENSKLQQHCDELKSLIESLTSELEALEDKCDLDLKKKADELRDKSKRLAELKQKVIECRCAAPADAAAQARRTASLAALCGCEPGGDDDDTCSCTSLRSKLLTDVLEGLFGGLHEEMAACATTMPCILLKCLEDNHDWDRASVIRTRLTDYFSKLLSGELDIAIENCIERYRAKWVGATCKSDSKNNGEQQDTVLYNVHEVTTLFAPQKFPNNVQRPEKEYFNDNHLPRTVKTSISTATFAVQYPSRPVVDRTPAVAAGTDRVAALAGASEHWRRTHQNVTQLRVEIEDLKKEAIKKEDLKVMQCQLTKIMRKTSNIVRLTSNNVQNNPAERKVCDTSHKSISKSKDVSSKQVDNKQILSEKISSTRIDKKEIIAKNIKKVNEIGLPPKKLFNKVENSSKVVGQGLILKTVRNSQASKIYSKNNYPQGFLFGKETKSTWMDTMSDPISKKKTQESVNISSPNRVLEKENKIAQSQNHSVENCSSDQSPKTLTEKAFDRLLEQFTKWTNARQLNSYTINENNQQHLNKNSERFVSLTRIKEKNDHTIIKNDFEQGNKNENGFVRSDKENVLKMSMDKSLQELSLSNQNAQSSLTSEKYPINTSQSIKENRNFNNLSLANKVQNDFYTNTKTAISSPKKSKYCYDESKVNYTNAFIENVFERLQKTDTVRKLALNQSKELISSVLPSKTYAIVDDTRNIFSEATEEKQKNREQEKGQLKVKPDSTEQEQGNTLDSKSLKTTFMKKIDSYESQSCISCCYKYKDEVSKVKKACTLHDSFFSNSSRCNEDEISKPISCPLKITEPAVTKNDTKDSSKIYEVEDLPIDWEKVHLLLYKYITTKIKRLQHTPETEANVNLMDNSSVSNLLSKLCYMIKNDLRKMKNLPTHQRENAQLQKGPSKKDKDCLFSVPKIEANPLLNLCKETKTFEVPPNNNNNSNATNGEILTLTMSCQVSGKIHTEDKSCLTIEKKYSQLKVIYDKNKIPICDRKKVYVSCACSPTVSDRQCSCNILKGCLSDKKWKIKTIDTIDSLNKNMQKKVPYNLNNPVKAAKSDQIADRNRSSMCKGKKFTRAICANRETGAATSIDFNIQRLTKSKTINEKEDVINKVWTPFTLSCFGCTVECVCDKSLGPCVCTKGILFDKRDEVEKLWNMSIGNKQNKLDNFNLYVSGERRITENSKALSTSKTISNNSKNTYRRSKTCEITSMNNLFIPSDVVSKTNNVVKNVEENSNADGSRSRCSSLKSEMGISLSESLCSQRTLLPNVNLGRHSTNSSLPVGKNIMSEIRFWSQVLPEELSERT